MSLAGRAVSQVTVTALRTMANVTARRNLAIAVATIVGKGTQLLRVISGPARDGFLTVASNAARIFEVTMETHALDSEVAIFENLAASLPADAEGIIYLFTERTACPWCWGIAEQFQAMFPAIKLVLGGGRW